MVVPVGGSSAATDCVVSAATSVVEDPSSLASLSRLPLPSPSRKSAVNAKFIASLAVRVVVPGILNATRSVSDCPDGIEYSGSTMQVKAIEVEVEDVVEQANGEVVTDPYAASNCIVEEAVPEIRML
jgi:hypothetical protein